MTEPTKRTISATASGFWDTGIGDDVDARPQLPAVRRAKEHADQLRAFALEQHALALGPAQRLGQLRVVRVVQLHRDSRDDARLPAGNLPAGNNGNHVAEEACLRSGPRCGDRIVLGPSLTSASRARSRPPAAAG